MENAKIVKIEAKKFIGMQTKTSLANSTTSQMWRQFMPRRNEVKNNVGDYLVCIQVYPSGFKMKDFTPETIFSSWAAIEVTDFDDIPAGMECRTIPGGLYAVFNHKGGPNSFHQTASYIFDTWIPRSKYELDDREHFEILGDKFLGPHDPNSEEEVWVPIKE